MSWRCAQRRRDKRGLDDENKVTKKQMQEDIQQPPSCSNSWVHVHEYRDS